MTVSISANGQRCSFLKTDDKHYHIRFRKHERIVISRPSHLSCILYSPLYLLVLIATAKVSRITTVVSRKREQRVLFMVVTMVVCYLLCWLPYGIMALMATFGRPGLITPAASIVPSVLAKTSTVINPIIYIFMNKQVGV